MVYQLRYRQHPDAPLEYREKYRRAYDDISSGRVHLYLSRWIAALQSHGVGTENDRKILDRSEGGIGGNSNSTCRQIRVAMTRERIPMLCFGEIVFEAQPSGDGNQQWSADELLSIGRCFKCVLETQVASPCIDFYIAVNCD